MSYKDTLTLYEELVATGIPDSQAKIMAHQQGEVVSEMNNIGTILDKTMHEINIKLANIDTSMNWMKGIGATLAVAIIGNIVAIIMK